MIRGSKRRHYTAELPAPKPASGGCLSSIILSPLNGNVKMSPYETGDIDVESEGTATSGCHSRCVQGKLACAAASARHASAVLPLIVNAVCAPLAKANSCSSTAPLTTGSKAAARCSPPWACKTMPPAKCSPLSSSPRKPPRAISACSRPLAPLRRPRRLLRRSQRRLHPQRRSLVARRTTRRPAPPHSVRPRS